ncbi:MAG TPA: helix-turn-helix domain-containing protein [Solirubrobacteraceae bacterium]|nr:helix-turn-helix domain-containing protein [Solirubrobacteraceae bacterium]
MTGAEERRRVGARAFAGAARLFAKARGVTGEQAIGRYASLIDARAASRILGVPHTWLLAQARAGKIPHHRLGHYVRFSPEDLRRWLEETRIEPNRRVTP